MARVESNYKRLHSFMFGQRFYSKLYGEIVIELTTENRIYMRNYESGVEQGGMDMGYKSVENNIQSGLWRPITEVKNNGQG
jgi:hypothetical protein